MLCREDGLKCAHLENRTHVAWTPVVTVVATPGQGKEDESQRTGQTPSRAVETHTKEDHSPRSVWGSIAGLSSPTCSLGQATRWGLGLWTTDPWDDGPLTTRASRISMVTSEKKATRIPSCCLEVNHSTIFHFSADFSYSYLALPKYNSQKMDGLQWHTLGITTGYVWSLGIVEVDGFTTWLDDSLEAKLADDETNLCTAVTQNEAVKKWRDWDLHFFGDTKIIDIWYLVR